MKYINEAALTSEYKISSNCTLAGNKAHGKTLLIVLDEVSVNKL